MHHNGWLIVCLFKQFISYKYLQYNTFHYPNGEHDFLSQTSIHNVQLCYALLHNSMNDSLEFDNALYDYRNHLSLHEFPTLYINLFMILTHSSCINQLRFGSIACHIPIYFSHNEIINLHSSYYSFFFKMSNKMKSLFREDEIILDITNQYHFLQNFLLNEQHMVFLYNS